MVFRGITVYLDLLDREEIWGIPELPELWERTERKGSEAPQDPLDRKGNKESASQVNEDLRASPAHPK